MEPITPAAIDLMERMVGTLADLKGETIRALKFKQRFNRGYTLIDFESGRWALLCHRGDDNEVDGEIIGRKEFSMVEMAVLMYADYCTREVHDAEYTAQRIASEKEFRQRDITYGRALIAKYPELAAEALAAARAPAGESGGDHAD